MRLASEGSGSDTLSRRRVLQGFSAVAVIASLDSRALSDIAFSQREFLTRNVEKIPEKVGSAPSGTLRLGGMLGRRVQVNVEKRLLRVDAQALLSCFVSREAVGGADQAWIGEHAGKFLDAACRCLMFEPRADLRDLVDRVAAGLLASQAPDGYLGTYPAGRRWTGWDVWIHKYTLIGLLKYHDLTGSPPALAACLRIFGLLNSVFGEASGQRDIILAGEHCGMAATSILEPICGLYQRTGDTRVLEFARYIVRAYDHPGGPGIVSALNEHRSVFRTANGKAYEMLSNLVGLIDLYRLSGDGALKDAVLAGWQDIRENQLYLTGTVSAAEHFQPPHCLRSFAASNVGETCATVTWLQLTSRLYALTGEIRFAEEIERTVYNHLLAAQDENSGDVCYYTALTGLKEYSHHLVCCVSSGPRGISMVPELVYGLDGRGVIVNLYAESRATFSIDEVPVDISVTTRFPENGSVLMRVHPARSLQFAVRLRVPRWVTRFDVQINGIRIRGQPGEYLELSRRWSPGTEVRVRMDLPVQQVSGGPEYPQIAAVQRGPQVLALEKSLNPKVPFLHRTAIQGTDLRPASALRIPANSLYRNAYRMRGFAGVARSGQELSWEKRELIFVPFADARVYRIWTSATARRRDVPSITAYARADISTAFWLTSSGRPSSRQFPEALTDENPETYCAIDPRDPTIENTRTGRIGQRDDEVWFTVILDSPARVSRIVFRQGPIDASGGWFDTREARPRIEISRRAIPSWHDTPYPNANGAPWEHAADLQSYPATDAVSARNLVHGQLFSTALAAPTVIYAIRIVGRAGGDFVTCAEIGAFITTA